jgi:hypothetical protein
MVSDHGGMDEARPNTRSADRRRDDCPLANLREQVESFSPVLFGPTAHRRRLRVLELEPIGRTARPVTRSELPLQAHLAGMAEDDPSGCSRCSFRRTPDRLLRRMLAKVALRTSIGSLRRSVPFSSSSRMRRGRPWARFGGSVTIGRQPRPPHRNTQLRRRLDRHLHF